MPSHSSSRSPIVIAGGGIGGLAAAMMGHLYHPKGVERLMCAEMYRGRTPESYSEALEWLYLPPLARA